MNEVIRMPQPSEVQQALMKPIATPQELMRYHDDMTRIIKEALKDKVDYGIIPGTKKPTLYKAGAERINIAFGTHPEYELVSSEIDHDRENKWNDKYRGPMTSFGVYRYVYKCKIVRSDGRTVGEGQGMCSTLETKYISRPRDSENTVCKMAQKRAFLAATLHSFGLSDRFTQDMEDQSPIEDVTPQKLKDPKLAAAQQGPVPKDVSAAAQPLTFDMNNLKHLDALERKLKAMEIPADKHDAIAAAYHGKPFTEDVLKDIAFQKNVIDQVF